jgi:hypothetical protein
MRYNGCMSIKIIDESNISGDLQDLVKESKSLQQSFVLKNINFEVPTWDEILNFMDYAFWNYEKLPVPEHYDAFGGIQIKYPYYTQIAHIRDMPKVKKFYNHFYSLLGSVDAETEGGGGMYVDFISKQHTSSAHFDGADNFHWQAQGKTLWKIGKVEDFNFVGEVDEIILEQSDMIFLPKGIGHEVEALTPRAGVTLPLWHTCDCYSMCEHDWNKK